MNGKHYLGKQVSGFELYNTIESITGIAFITDDNHEVFAGSDSGYVLEIKCPYATEEMAEAALLQVQSRVYRGYKATGARLGIYAELGDGVTVNGMYSLLAQQTLNFGPGHRSEIAAPGDKAIDHEYPYLDSTTRALKRTKAETRSMIEKTAEEILLKVTNLDKGFTALKVTLDGVTVTDTNGTTRIKGSSIETDSLYVNSANIKGTVSASVLKGQNVSLDTAAGAVAGTIGITGADTASYAIDLASYGALRLTALTGAAYLASESHGTFLTCDYFNASGGNFGPQDTDIYALGLSNRRWSEIYASTSTIATSDRNAKNSIEELPEEYLSMFSLITPKRFKLNAGRSGRYHVGFIAQEVEEAMAAVGLNSLDFAGFVKDKDEDGNDIYMLRYEEFIGILAAKIKQLESRISKSEG